MVASAAGLMCGGTTGREGLPVSANPGATMDATVPTDSALVDDGGVGDGAIALGAFDADIVYVMQQLPDVQAAPAETDASSEDAGDGLPNCPPWAFVTGPKSQVVATGPTEYIAPTDYGPDGGNIFAVDGGACATYPWFGSVGCDSYKGLADNSELGSNTVYPLLPPCNWAADSGAATVGSGATQQRYDLCIALYECFMQTKCFVRGGGAGVPYCLCGYPASDPQYFGTDCVNNPQGPCLNEELAAMEISTSEGQSIAIQTALANFTSEDEQSLSGEEGELLNAAFAYIFPSIQPYPTFPVECQAPFATCFAADAGPACGPCPIDGGCVQ